MAFTTESLLFSLLLLAFVALAAAKIAEYDEYWKKRAEVAHNNSMASYHHDPEGVANTFNKNVARHVDNHHGNETARRSLRNKKWNGPCQALNPIDACWRCKKNWARDRKRLAKCGMGFGRGATGGAAGKFYVVTDPSDSDLINPRKGTLRYGVTRDPPLWITFAHSMAIRLQEELIVNDDKTIDGRGVKVHIVGGAGITVQYVKNVILHNIYVHDIKKGPGGLIRDSETHYGLRTESDGDAISIFGSTNVWVDHVSLSNCVDGLIDVIQASTSVTISNCHFSRHNEVMLLGASNKFSKDKIMQVTIAFNHFGKRLTQRMPRARWGYIHVVNNDYTHWLMYAIGGSKHPIILSQGNRFIAPMDINAKEITKREYTPESLWKDWSWRSEGDLFQGGAFFVKSGAPSKHTVNPKDMIKPQPGTQVSKLTRFAGPLPCVVNKRC